VRPSGPLADLSRALCVLSNDADTARWKRVWPEFLPPSGGVAFEREECLPSGKKRIATSTLTRRTATGQEVGPMFKPFRCSEAGEKPVCEGPSATGQHVVLTFAREGGAFWVRRIQRSELTGCAC
jgi:hypothetical protein